MSTFTECVGCLQHPLKWETLMAMLIQVDADGSHYLNLNFNECLDCEDYSPAVDCVSPQSLIEMFALLIVEDECGNCALNFKSNICEACE